MGRYKIEYSSEADRFLDRLRDKQLLRRISRALLSLEDNPTPSGAIKLVGRTNEWRIRVGDYRIIYEIEDDILRILVIRIGHRRDVYD